MTNPFDNLNQHMKSTNDAVGLSKRELFAVHILSGLVSGRGADEEFEKDEGYSFRKASRRAVQLADILQDALKRTS